jgi:hypothetical protein
VTPEGEKQWLSADGNWYSTESAALLAGLPQPSSQMTPPTPAAYPSPPPVYGTPPVYGQSTNPQRPFNGTAITAFVFAFLFWPLGIILGHVARSKIRHRGERGGGLALAGLIISYLWGAVVVVLVVAALATHGGGAGETQAELQSTVLSNVPKDIPGVTKVVCVMPSSWAQGKTFQCFAYNSGGQELAQMDGTVLPNEGGRYDWNEVWGQPQ